MSSVIGRTADAESYSVCVDLSTCTAGVRLTRPQNITMSLYSQWKTAALGSGQHLLVGYYMLGSWTLGNNLFADVWLRTNVVESSVCIRVSRFTLSLRSPGIQLS